MNKYLLFVCCLIFLPMGLVAQNNLVTNYNPHWNLLGSRQLPSKLGRDYSTVQVSLISSHVYGGNNAIGFGSARNLTTEEINSTINKLKPRNNAGAGLDLDLFAMSVKIKKQELELFTLSAMVTERTGANIVFSENLMKLLWRGNKQFAGERVELGPLAAHYTYFREYAIGAAVPLQMGLPERFKTRIGARFKYLQGFAAMHMPKADAALFTEQDGRYLEFDMDYEVNTAIERDVKVLNLLNSPLGSGFGTDLGITVNHKNRFEGSLSLLDLGFISYNKHTTAYTLKGLSRYEGMEVSDLFDNTDFNIDSALVGSIKGDEQRGRTFSMPTSTRLMLQGEYKVPGKTNKDREYIRTAIYATYIQGINNLPGATTRPFFAAGVMQSIGYVLNLGGSVSYGGYNQLAIGAFGSVRMGALRVGIGSSNVSYLVAKNSTTGADFSLNMSWCFGGTSSTIPRPFYASNLR